MSTVAQPSFRRHDNRKDRPQLGRGSPLSPRLGTDGPPRLSSPISWRFSYGSRGTGLPSPWASVPGGSCPVVAHQRLDPVDDPLRGFAKLLDGAVCRVSLGHIVGPGMVDQPLREGREEHQFTLGTGDEAIAKPVEPELRSARLADAAVEVMPF